jgi:hypothetical protein
MEFDLEALELLIEEEAGQLQGICMATCYKPPGSRFN